MKTEPFRIPRRSFLRGLGVTMRCRCSAMRRHARSPRWLGAESGAHGFLFVPNGAHMPDWTPLAEGADFDLPPYNRCRRTRASCW
jgi:hypothetical protein